MIIAEGWFWCLITIPRDFTKISFITVTNETVVLITRSQVTRCITEFVNWSTTPWSYEWEWWGSTLIWEWHVVIELLGWWRTVWCGCSASADLSEWRGRAIALVVSRISQGISGAAMHHSGPTRYYICGYKQRRTRTSVHTDTWTHHTTCAHPIYIVHMYKCA